MRQTLYTLPNPAVQVMQEHSQPDDCQLLYILLGWKSNV